MVNLIHLVDLIGNHTILVHLIEIDLIDYWSVYGSIDHRFVGIANRDDRSIDSTILIHLIHIVNLFVDLVVDLVHMCFIHSLLFIILLHFASLWHHHIPLCLCLILVG